MNESSKAELAEELYAHILQVANRMLRNSKRFSIEILKLEDPSYTEIANQLRELCEILEVLSKEEYTVHKAYEYAHNVRDIATAIQSGNEEELKRHVNDLERRPFL